MPDLLSPMCDKKLLYHTLVIRGFTVHTSTMMGGTPLNENLTDSSFGTYVSLSRLFLIVAPYTPNGSSKVSLADWNCWSKIN